MSADKPLYPRNLRPWELEPFYARHVMAMTSEKLHLKSEIAEQLAWRDWLASIFVSALNRIALDRVPGVSCGPRLREWAREVIGCTEIEPPGWRSGESTPKHGHWVPAITDEDEPQWVFWSAENELWWSRGGHSVRVFFWLDAPEPEETKLVGGTGG